MLIQTPTKKELFASTLKHPVVRVFAAVLALVVISFTTPVSRGFITQLLPEQPVATAATNSALNFQARLQNATGAIAADGTYNIQFKLYDVNSGGTALWTESYLYNGGAPDQRVTVKNGYITTNLGSLTAFPTTINWDQDLWLTMNIGGTGTVASWDGEMSPRLKLTASAYAFRAGQLAKNTGANTSTLDFATQTASRSILLPDENGTICLQNSTNCGFLTGSAANGSYVQLQSTSPGVAQTGHLNLSGTGILGTSLSTPVVTSAAALAVSSTTTLSVTSGTTLTLASTGANAVSLDSGTTGAINIGTNANAKTVTIGNGTGASSVVINAGTGPIDIGTNAIARTTTIGNTTGASSVVINCGTGACSFGASASAHTTTVGSTTGTATTVIQSGSGGITLTGNASVSGTLGVTGNATFSGNIIVSTGSITQSGYLVADGASDDMVVNGDFERNNTTGWTGITSIVNGGYSGNYAARVLGSSTVEGVDYIPVDPTRDVFQLEAYIKKSVAGTTPGTMYFGYKAYTASKTVIGTAPCGSYCYFAAAGTVVPVDSQWHKYTATTTGEGTAYPNFPVGTKYVRILGLINYTSSADSETLIDHISLKRISNGALFVGNNFSATNMLDQHQHTQLYTAASGVLNINTQSSADVNLQSGGLQVGGTNVITAGRALQNVTADTAILTSGTLGIARGGTGAASFTSYGVIYGNGTSALGVTAAGITGDCLVATTGGAPSWQSCSVAGGGGSPSGAAGGDLSGTYPNPTVAKIQGTALNISGPTAGQILVWNGTGWTNLSASGDVTISSAGVLTIGADSVALGTDTTGNYVSGATAGTGISITGSAGEGWTPTIAVDGTVCLTSNNCGYAPTTGGNGYVQLQGATPGTAQTGHFNISGTGVAGAFSTSGNVNASSVIATSGNFNNVQTNGTQRIDASGNLINISSLTASGNLTSTGGVLSVQGTGDNYLAGSLGVGIATPTEKLVSVGTSANYALMLDNSSSDGATNKWRISPTGSAWVAGDNKLVFTYENATSSSSMLTIQGSTGNVGIGTTSPAQRLHVAGGDIRIDANQGIRGYNGTAEAFLLTTSGTELQVGSGGWDHIDFDVQGVTGGTALRIANGGNVGIGTTAVGAKLHIVIPNTSTVPLLVESNDGTDILKLQQYATTDRAQLLVGTYNGLASPNYSFIADNNTGISGGFSADTMHLVTGGVARLTVDSVGNVGIGTTNPAGYRLNVQGGDVNFSGNLLIGGTITGTQLISTVATGTAPLTVASSTLVANLNADLLDGLDSAAFAAATGSGNYIQAQASSPGTAQNTNFNIGTGIGTAAVYNATTGVRIAGAAASGTYLRGNGTNFVGSAIQAADVPTLNQNTTGSAYYLVSRDTRAVNDLPQDYGAVVKYDFKQNTTNGLSDGGTYNGVMTWRKYGGTLTDFTGGPALQMAYSDNGNLWTRLSTSATTWGSWSKILNDASGVLLQTTTPGTTQTGHLSISGTALFGGNVGIGTTTPDDKLDIEGSAVGLRVTDTNGYNFTIKTDGAGGRLILARSGTNILAVNSSGNVGIGTTAPQSSVRLEVRGATYNGLNVSSADSSGLSLIPDSIHSYITNNAYYDGTNWVRRGTGTASQLINLSGNSGGIITLSNAAAGANPITWNERLRIDGSGNVGIGTTSPGAKLQVNAGNAGGNGIILSNNDAFSLQDSGGTARRVLLVSGANTTYLGQVDAGWGTSAFVSSGADTTFRVNGASGTFTSAMFIQGSTGNVGIGTTSPGNKLEVVGTTQLRLTRTGVGGWDTSITSNVAGFSGHTGQLVWKPTAVQGSTLSSIVFADYSSVAQHAFSTVGDAYHAGKLGIGVTGPNYSLEIKPTAGNAALNIQNSAGSNLLTLTGSSPALVMSTQGYGIFYGSAISGVRLGSTADSSGSIALVARGITGQTADLFQVRDNATNNNVLMNVDAIGRVAIQNQSNSTNAVQVRNASSGVLFNADTLNSRVGINVGTASVANLEVGGDATVPQVRVSNPSGNYLDFVVSSNGQSALNTDQTMLQFKSVNLQPNWTLHAAWNMAAPASSMYASPTMADLDADGDDDMLAGFGTAAISPGYTATRSAAPAGYTSSLPCDATNRNNVAFGDFTGDGIPDAVCGTKTSTSTGVLAYRNSGTLAAPTWVASSTVAYNTGQIINVSLADLNSDGKMDIIQSPGNNNSILVNYNTGTTGTPTWSSANSLSHTTTGLYGVRSAGDLTGDGLLDLVYVGTSNIYLSKNTGTASTPTFNAAAATSLATVTTNTYGSISLIDYDADGLLDLTFSTFGSASFQFYRNTGTATAPVFTRNASWDISFTTSVVSPIPTVAFVPVTTTYGNRKVNTTIYHTNIVYNATSEVLGAVENAPAGTVKAYRNTGSNLNPIWTAQPAWDVTTTAYFPAPSLADLNSDGKKDVAIGSEDGISYAYQNTGTASVPAWTAAGTWNLTDVGNYAVPTFGDLNNDAKLDVLIGAEDGSIYAYQNTGSASVPAWTRASAWDVGDVGDNAAPVLGNLDSDSDLDLIVGAADGNTYAYKNVGSITAPTWNSYGNWSGADVGNYAVPALTDLGNDGDLDLMVGDYTGAVTAQENTRSGDATQALQVSNEGFLTVGNYSASATAKLNVVVNTPNTDALLVTNSTNLSSTQATFAKAIGATTTTSNYAGVGGVTQLDDESYAMLYNSTGITAQVTDPVVSKFDNSGNLLWSRYVGSNTARYAVRLIKLADGNLLAVTSSAAPPSTTNTYQLWKLSGSDGTVMWSKAYSLTGYASDPDVAILTAAAIPDGGFYLAGSTRIGTDDYGALYKFDSNGTQIDSATLSMTDGTYISVMFMDIEVTSDYGVIAVGRVYHDAALNDSYMLAAKFTASGNLEWTQNMGHSVNGNNSVLDAVTIGEDGYYVGGAVGSRPYVAKIGFSGSVIWSQTITSTDSMLIRDVVIGANDNLLLVGNDYSGGGSNNKQITISSFSQAGMHQWTKAFSPDSGVNQGTNWSSNLAQNIPSVATSDGGLALAAIYRPTSTTYSSALLKFDANGTMAGCSPVECTTLTPTIVGPSLISQTFTTTVAVTGVPTNSGTTATGTSSMSTTDIVTPVINTVTVAMGTLLQVASSGNVCIGLSDCTNKLGVAGSISASGNITANSTPDIAEYIPAALDVEAADVVMADPDRVERVVKATGAYTSAAVGVISDGTSSFIINPYGSVSGAPTRTDIRPLVLAGRVPVKVTGENGPVRPGDYLTTSSKSGYAMKATKAGATIGKSLGYYSGETTEDEGKVLTLVNIGYHDPNARTSALQGNTLSLSGDATIEGNAKITEGLIVGGLAAVNTLKVSGDASIGGDLAVAGTAKVKTLQVGNHILSMSDAPLVAVGSAAGQDGLVTIDGTDVAGTLSITVKAKAQQGDQPAEVLVAGSLADVTFLNPYKFAPRIVISPLNDASVGAPVYLVKTATGYKLMIKQSATDGAVYQFDYIIVGAQQTAASTQ